MRSAALLVLLLAAPPEEELQDETKAVAIDCDDSPCASEPPADAFDQPRCSDYELNDSLIKAAERGDRSALQLLEDRYATADTFSERHRIATTLLGRIPNDAEIWNELASHAEMAVRFPHAGMDPVPEYLRWCEERGFDAYEYWSMAVSALYAAGVDPRSNPLLRRALETDDSFLITAAVFGLAKQRDLDSLPFIERAIERFPDLTADLVIPLGLMRHERADALAVKYLKEDNLAVYMQWRNAEDSSP